LQADAFVGSGDQSDRCCGHDVPLALTDRLSGNVSTDSG
jgi:hypothetical protein